MRTRPATAYKKSLHVFVSLSGNKRSDLRSRILATPKAVGDKVQYYQMQIWCGKLCTVAYEAGGWNGGMAELDQLIYK